MEFFRLINPQLWILFMKQFLLKNSIILILFLNRKINILDSSARQIILKLKLIKNIKEKIYQKIHRNVFSEKQSIRAWQEQRKVINMIGLSSLYILQILSGTRRENRRTLIIEGKKTSI